MRYVGTDGSRPMDGTNRQKDSRQFRPCYALLSGHMVQHSAHLNLQVQTAFWEGNHIPQQDRWILKLKGTLQSVKKTLYRRLIVFATIFWRNGDFLKSINSVVDFSLHFKWDWRGRSHFSSFIYGVTSLVSEWSRLLMASSSKKDKVFPYSLPSVGPRAYPGVQAVSPQVTWSESRHRLAVGCHYFLSSLQLPP